MRIPSRQWRFAGDLHADPLVVAPPELQRQLVRHPFGMSALMAATAGSGARRWNDDGWDRLEPPVITIERRREAVAAIGTLEADQAVCRLPRLHKEEYGGEVPAGWEACLTCPVALAAACAAVTQDVATAYRLVIDETLRLLAGDAGKLLPRVKLRALLTPLATADYLAGLAIMTVGRAPIASTPIVRINRWDGVRVELKLDGRRLIWLTTIRRPSSPQTALTRLLQFPDDPADPRLPLSEHCLVTRPWWQRTTGAPE